MIQDDRTTGERVFRFIKGPVFANIVLADEINRTPPKTQAALLESMQEKSVTVAGKQHKLSLPFFVLATQNPLEQEGTYPLPEAQLDRFFFKIFVNYPSDEEELEIMKRITMPSTGQIKPVLNAEQISLLQDIVLRVPVADHVYAYAKKLVRSTRPAMGEAPDFIKNWINWGAGPARQHLPDPGRQGARHPERPVPRLVRRHRGRRAFRPAPPHRLQFHRAGRRHHHGQGDRETVAGRPEDGETDHGAGGGGVGPGAG